MNYLKNILLKGLVLPAVIYQMHTVLSLLIIYEKEKINIIVLLVRKNPIIYFKCQ